MQDANKVPVVILWLLLKGWFLSHLFYGNLSKPALVNVHEGICWLTELSRSASSLSVPFFYSCAMVTSSGQKLYMQRFSSALWFHSFHIWFIALIKKIIIGWPFLDRFSNCLSVLFSWFLSPQRKERRKKIYRTGTFVDLIPALYMVSHSDRWIWRSLPWSVAHAWKDGHHCCDKDAKSRPEGTAEERVFARGFGHWTVQQHQYHQAGGSGHQE